MKELSRNARGYAVWHRTTRWNLLFVITLFVLHEEEDEKEPMQPLQMYFNHTAYNKQIKNYTRCFITKAAKSMGFLRHRWVAASRDGLRHMLSSNTSSTCSWQKPQD